MPSLSNNELSLLISANDRASPVLSSFGKAVGKTTSAISDMTDQIKAGLNQASGALAVVSVGLTAYAKSSVDYVKGTVTNTLALQRQIGGTVEDASRLTYAMQRLGIDSGSASVAFNTLSKKIQDTDGPLKDIHVSTTNANGSQRSFNSVLLDVADRFKAMPDGAKKTALAIELFGRSGGDLVKVLNNGKDGILALQAQADKLGVTLTNSSVGAVLAYTKSQKDLAESTDALRTRVGLLAAPALTTLNNILLSMSQKVTEANTPLNAMIGNIAAFGGPVAGAGSALLGFAANVFTIDRGIGVLFTTITGLVTALVGGGGLAFAFGQLIGVDFSPLQQSALRLFNQLIDSTNKSIKGVEALADTPGWQKMKAIADESVGKVAGYMDKLTTSLAGGGFKGAIKLIADDLKALDINGIIGSWITKFVDFPWEQHTEGIVNGTLRLLSAFADKTEEFIAKATPSFLKIAMGIINGLIKGIIDYALENPLDFVILLLSLGFLPSKVVTALGTVLSKIPIAGPIAEWVVAAMKVAADFVTGPIKKFFGGVGDVMVKGIKEGWDGAVGWLTRIVGGGLDGIKVSVSHVWDYIKDFNWGSAIAGAGKSIGNALIALLEGGINGALSGLPGAPKVKLPRFARGTNYAPGGLALVGEEGPELVNLPRGSKVSTASETRQVMAGQAGPGVTVTQNIYNQVDYEQGWREIGFRFA